MLCEKCNKNEATFFYHENVNGQVRNYKLCADCANELQKNGELNIKDFTSSPFDSIGKFFANPFKSMDKLFSGVFGETPSLLSSISSGKPAAKCDCGMTLNDFLENGMAGCPSCYETFENDIEPTVKRIHGKTVHEGHSPARFREKNDLKKQIEKLEKERTDAVSSENYEKAAEIRDKINELKNQLKGE